MKKTLLTHLLIFACTFCAAITLNAQSIHVVPNPTTADSSNFSGPELSGYLGCPIIYNNSLILKYNPTPGAYGNSEDQLAVYTGGDSLHLIPNPPGDGSQGVYFDTNDPTDYNGFIYNGKVYFIYIWYGQYQLAEYSTGDTIKLISNPAGYAVFSSSGDGNREIVYNNKLYIVYSTQNSSYEEVFQVGMFDGTSTTFIPNPDSSSSRYNGGFYAYQIFNSSIVFNNKLYMNYVSAVTGANQLAQYDGNKWSLFPNPDTSLNGCQGQDIEYNNKLYMAYQNASGSSQLMVFDGTKLSLIPNPDTGPGYYGDPILFNNKLFINYYDAAGISRLASFDGTSITLVPNPDTSTYGFNGIPVVYDNNLYMEYKTPDQETHLAQYLPGSNSLKVFPNTDGGRISDDVPPIVFDNNLYFTYHNATSTIFQLAYFDGTSIKVIPNPPGNYMDTTNYFYGYNYNGYTGYPIIWNNTLYMQFASVPFANAGNLAFLNAGALPVSLLNLQAKYVAANDILVSWQTASEDNNKGFEVERSNDGNNFSAIGFVDGAVNSDVLLNYSFTDNSGITGKVFYRLKQIDEDGNAKYSNIVYVDISQQNTITFSPNPAQSAVTINSSVNVREINLVNISGQVIKRWNNISPNQKLDISNISKGVYFLKFVNDDFTQVSKLIKE